MLVIVVRLVGPLIKKRIDQKHKPRKCSHPESGRHERKGTKQCLLQGVFLTVLLSYRDLGHII